MQKHFRDAFGNTTEGCESGVWGGVRGGFHHNSKEFDEDAELVYMYQRWYLPKVGVFVSSAPYPPMVEHPYGFGYQNPVTAIDPLGENPLLPTPGGIYGTTGAGLRC